MLMLCDPPVPLPLPWQLISRHMDTTWTWIPYACSEFLLPEFRPLTPTFPGLQCRNVAWSGGDLNNSLPSVLLFIIRYLLKNRTRNSFSTREICFYFVFFLYFWLCCLCKFFHCLEWLCLGRIGANLGVTVYLKVDWIINISNYILKLKFDSPEHYK